MVVWCICFMSFLVSFGGIMSRLSSFIDCLCTAPLTLGVMVVTCS